MDSPILLSSGPIALLSGQALEVNNTSRLQNPFRTAMMLDEIRFTMFDGSFQNFLRAKFRLGRTPLTNDYVPFGNFGRQLNGVARQMTWRLPKPLYLPPEEFLVPHLSNVYTSTLNVEIVYAGRSLPSKAPVPKSIFVPWVSVYQAPNAVIPGAGDTIVQSTEGDIVNPFNEPLHVQRFLGRYLSTFPPPSGNGGEAYADIVDNTFIRAVDHEGTIMVKDSTPFGSLFHSPTKAWGARTVLPPKGFYLFEIQRNFANLSMTTPAQTTAPIISMVGYREVALR